ncbi:N-acetylmuramoyl-L-alanine amidase [Streptomyces ochraceiscleroticus]|uniref:N-acetylmuramoyl-L-alanine amidase n=1 Tax=Streptomyces ochraceiscleroticus TaxID=47761 RepID=A0ABW1MPD6_9ACTN
MRGSAPVGVARRDAPRTPRSTTRRAGTAVAVAALLLPLVSAAPTATAGSDAGSLQRAFADASARYGVPQSVLLGVAYLESRWDGHQGAPSVAGGYGPMHLTDARTALAREAPHHSEGTEDARGDDARPRKTPEAALPKTSALPARLRTLPKAAALTGLSARELRESAAANVSGGAALLADQQRRLGLKASADPADWYAAVARYSGASEAKSATVFADQVYDVLRDGASRTTDAGQRVTLAKSPGLTPDRAQTRVLGLREAPSGNTECPSEVACESVPAPYQELGDDDYGNHDLADRPEDQSVDYIVIHDTEATWETTLKLVQDPTYVSWHYSLRSADGLIAQHVPTKDVGWHAGNWYVNSRSIGLEHEGFLAAPDAWYTEAMYRTSARLVRYLARKYDIPLDRQHVLGHDNVPGTTTASIKGMHTDPGPYWDWDHYFILLGRPLVPTAGPHGGLVTIRPEYEENQPAYTGCEKAGQPCAAHGSGAVRLYSAPNEDAPLIKDEGLHPGGGDSTSGVNDTGARASTGQQFAVAERKGDWTAIWYLGQKAWFHNPGEEPTAVDARGWVAVPKEGRTEIPVYGRAYPEKAAYPAGVPVQSVSPLPYTLKAGQRYAAGGRTLGEYFYAPTFDTSKHVVVRGKDAYYEIQVGHRVGYVRAADVDIRRSGR